MALGQQGQNKKYEFLVTFMEQKQHDIEIVDADSQKEALEFFLKNFKVPKRKILSIEKLS